MKTTDSVEVTTQSIPSSGNLLRDDAAIYAKSAGLVHSIAVVRGCCVKLRNSRSALGVSNSTVVAVPVSAGADSSDTTPTLLYNSGPIGPLP